MWWRGGCTAWGARWQALRVYLAQRSPRATVVLRYYRCMRASMMDCVGQAEQRAGRGTVCLARRCWSRRRLLVCSDGHAPSYYRCMLS